MWPHLETNVNCEQSEKVNGIIKKPHGAYVFRVVTFISMYNEEQPMQLEPIQIEFRLGGKKAFLMGSPAGSSSSSMQQCRAMQFIVKMDNKTVSSFQRM